jgi:hypothetical protein
VRLRRLWSLMKLRSEPSPSADSDHRLDTVAIEAALCRA